MKIKHILAMLVLLLGITACSDFTDPFSSDPYGTTSSGGNQNGSGGNQNGSGGNQNGSGGNQNGSGGNQNG